MISIKYDVLFDIEVLHDYYTSGKSADFDLIPTSECKTKLSMYGLKFLPAAFGGKVFARVTPQDAKDIMQRPLPDKTKFSFVMKLKTNAFENFTSLNLNKAKSSHYYFNNLTPNLSAGNAPLLVADAALKTVSDNDVLPFASGAFSTSFAGDATPLTGTLRFNDSGQTFTQTLNGDHKIFNFSFDLNKTPTGRARFLIGDDKKASLYVIDAADNTNSFGVIEIFHSTALTADYRFQLSDNSVKTIFYKIPFKTRATKWRYLVTRKYNQAVTGVSAGKTNGSPIAFTAVTNPAPPAGSFVLVSNAALPFKELPVTGIKLLDQSSNAIIPHLPNPSLNVIKAEGADVFSDILITI